MSKWRELIEQHHDRDFLVATLQQFIRTRTDPEEGQTQVAPDDPKVTHFVHNVFRPILESVGRFEAATDAWNNVVITLGRPGSGGLLLLTYCVVHHGNRMPDPYSGRVANGADFGCDEDCVFGRGASESKGPLAAALTALKTVRDAAVELKVLSPGP